MSLKPPRPDFVVESVEKTWSFKLLAICSAVAGLEQTLPALQGILPPHWYAVAFPTILIARVLKQSLESSKG